MSTNIWNKLTRTTNSTRFVPEIDGIRFFAIFTVIIFHLNTALSRHLDLDWKLLLGEQFNSLGWWIVRMDLGVKVFFALSGFVLTIPFMVKWTEERTLPNIGNYFKRRLLRLEPPFIVTTLLFFVVQLILLKPNIYTHLNHLGATLIYSHYFIFEAPSPINPVTWSLETEFQFYCILPILFLIAFKLLKIRSFVALFVPIFFVTLYLKEWIYTNEYSAIQASFLQYSSHFIIGIIFCIFYLSSLFKRITPSLIADLLGLVAIFLLFYFYKPQVKPINTFVFNACIFCFFFAVFKGKVFNYFFTRKIVYVIGGMCYTIYLIHYAFLHIFISFIPSHLFVFSYEVDLLVAAAISLPPLFALCVVFYIYLEKPCMNPEWPNFIFKKLKKAK